jgi:hypothetical protein
MPLWPLRLAGLLCLALAASHAFYPRRFGWREQLRRVPPFTRQVFWVHTLFIVLVLVEQGLLLALRPDLVVAPTPLGAAVSGGLAFFWGFRLVAQWAIYDRSLWVGRRFETGVHWAFTGLWTFFTAVFAWAFVGQVTA